MVGLKGINNDIPNCEIPIDEEVITTLCLFMERFHPTNNMNQQGTGNMLRVLLNFSTQACDFFYDKKCFIINQQFNKGSKLSNWQSSSMGETLFTFGLVQTIRTRVLTVKQIRNMLVLEFTDVYMDFSVRKLMQARSKTLERLLAHEAIDKQFRELIEEI